MTSLLNFKQRLCFLTAFSITTLTVFTISTLAASPVYAMQAATEGETVLVPGDPDLTQDMANKAIGCLAFVLDAPLTVEQRSKLLTNMKEDWKKKDPNTISLVKDFSTLYTQILQKTDAERAFIRKKVQPEVLKALMENKNDEGAKWMLAIYNAAHKPIAPGNPPLTRQMTDAYTEVFYFKASEVIGEKFTPTTQAKEAFAKLLASGYSKASATERKNINQMPLVWAAIRVAWPTFPEEEKKAARIAWAKDLVKLLPPSATPKKTASTSSKTSKTYSSSGSTKTDFASRMRALNNMNAAYQSLNKTMWEGHYSRMNSIATFGGSPYRYVNSYGNPY